MKHIKTNAIKIRLLEGDMAHRKMRKKKFKILNNKFNLSYFTIIFLQYLNYSYIKFISIIQWIGCNATDKRLAITVFPTGEKWPTLLNPALQTPTSRVTRFHLRLKIFPHCNQQPIQISPRPSELPISNK
mgnify:CR=1 FL=1